MCITYIIRNGLKGNTLKFLFFDSGNKKIFFCIGKIIHSKITFILFPMDIQSLLFDQHF